MTALTRTAQAFLACVLCLAATVSAQAVKAVVVTPSAVTLKIGDSVQFSASSRLANGAISNTRAANWYTTKSDIASVAIGARPTVWVKALSPGQSTITAGVERASGSAFITVLQQLPPPPAPVATVSVTASKNALKIGDTTTATAVARDSSGDPLSGRAVTWTSTAAAIAAVNGTGLITALSAGTTLVQANVEGKVGSTPINVAAVPVDTTKPPPDTLPKPVATVAVTVASSISVGQTAQASAVLKDASGNTLAGRVVAWTSSGAAASVSSSGMVTGVAVGSVNIVATSEGKSGQSGVTVSAASPPSPGHPHEPAGFQRLAPTVSCDTVPLEYSGYDNHVNPVPYELGWIQAGNGTTDVPPGPPYNGVYGAGGIHIVVDSTVPFASKRVCEVGFPSGFNIGTPGGTGVSNLWTYQWQVNPSNWSAMTPPRSPQSLYMSFWYKSSNPWPINLVANKVIYPHEFYGQVRVATMLCASSDYLVAGKDSAVLDPFHGVYEDAEWRRRQYAAAIFPCVSFQAAELDGKPSGGSASEWWNGIPIEKIHQFRRGVWHHFETLYTMENVGKADGSARMWFDGNLIINVDKRLRFFPEDTVNRHFFHDISWNTVYGGGGSLPDDGQCAPKSTLLCGYRMKDMYASGEPEPATQRRATPTRQTVTPVPVGKPIPNPPSSRADSVFKMSPPPARATRPPLKVTKP